MSGAHPSAIAAARARILQELAALDAEERQAATPVTPEPDHLANAKRAALARRWGEVAQHAKALAAKHGRTA